MTTRKQKRKKIDFGLKVSLIFLGIFILIPALLIAKFKFDEFNDKRTMEYTLADVSVLYSNFILAVPDKEKLAYKPENTCAYISHLFGGYACQVKGSVKYDKQDGDLDRFFQYVDRVIDLNTFSVISKGSSQAYEKQLYRVYEIKDKKTQMKCSISGSSEADKVRFTFLCKKHSNFLLYGFEDDRKDEALYSD